jgi:hypothetical protein
MPINPTIDQRPVRAAAFLLGRAAARRRALRERLIIEDDGLVVDIDQLEPIEPTPADDNEQTIKDDE